MKPVVKQASEDDIEFFENKLYPLQDSILHLIEFIFEPHPRVGKVINKHNFKIDSKNFKLIPFTPFSCQEKGDGGLSCLSKNKVLRKVS
jgi:hypothetical protein